MTGATGAAGMEGPAALPRKNGELVFEEPWHSRLFGATLAMHQSGLFEWRDFQGRLVEAIAAHAEEAYYERWLESLERLVVEEGLVTSAEIERRAGEYERLERDLLD